MIDGIQNEDGRYDVALVGGGLAGLSLSIVLSRLGHRVVLFEKERYPFHRVCGEYISLESWNFLEQLGLPLGNMALPQIQRLEVTSPQGRKIVHGLPLGGFGISRYTLDRHLYRIAIESGVTVMEGTKVDDVVFRRKDFVVQVQGREIVATMAAGTHGKRSNLDVRWKRPFIRSAGTRLSNYIGVKYHIEIDHPSDLIALHNFRDGYCGISAVDGGHCCLCYLTTSRNLREQGGNIKLLEERVLMQNASLREIFSRAKFLYEEPLAIAQISFERKSQVERHLLMVGDSAGMITPLCGNGMSMALHGAKIAGGLIDEFLKGGMSRDELERRYLRDWQQQFSRRLRTGRMVQSLFGRNWMTELFVGSLKPFPGIVDRLIRQTHGNTF